MITAHRVEKFWSHVDQSGGPHACWPWLLSLETNGYGKFGDAVLIVRNAAIRGEIELTWALRNVIENTSGLPWPEVKGDA